MGGVVKRSRMMMRPSSVRVVASSGTTGEASITYHLYTTQHMRTHNIPETTLVWGRPQAPSHLLIL